MITEGAVRVSWWKGYCGAAWLGCNQDNFNLNSNNNLNNTNAARGIAPPLARTFLTPEKILKKVSVCAFYEWQSL